MIVDWLLREGSYIVSWWVLATLAGAAALPYCIRMLSGLPDHGITLARSLGVLLVAFVYWLLASLGLLANTTGGMVLAWALVLVFGLMIARSTVDRPSVGALWRENRPVIIAGELLFAVLLVAFALFRAYYPDTATTEKPMDLMFITSIMNSPVFPPLDNWLAGYAISYYHFGYLMAAMLTMLSGVSNTVGYSMTLALWFAMTGVNAFGVVYNLVRSQSSTPNHPEHVYQSRRSPLLFGGLGVVFVLFLSNLQLPLIELPWQNGQGTAAYYNFWGTQDRFGDSPRPDNATLSLDPSTWDYWWWFRASRVLTDFGLDGGVSGTVQPIDEFPAFSFLLGDAHPHVLALPFGLLALGLAFNVLSARRNPSIYDLVFYGVTIGSFVFLNTWDILAYFGAFIGADALRRIMRNDSGRLNGVDLLSLFGDALVFLVVTVASYGLFLYSFRSQAGGITANVLFPTYFPNFVVMFGPFIVLLGTFLCLEIWRGRRTQSMNWRFGSYAGLLTLGSVLLLALLAVVLYVLNPQAAGLTQNIVSAAGGWEEVIPRLVTQRLLFFPTTLLLLLAVVIIVARLFPRLPWPGDKQQTNAITYTRAGGFTLLLTGIGVVLALAPEYLFLSDVFQTRINTIFKFYYQTWAVWGIASAYACYSVLADARGQQAPRWVRYTFGALLPALLGVCLLYPVLGVYSRMMVEPYQVSQMAVRYWPVDDRVRVQEGQVVAAGDLLVASDPPIYAQNEGIVQLVNEVLWVRARLTMDGGRFMIPPDDYAMVRCLSAAARPGEIAVEAERHAYRPTYGRAASIGGVPILLGWENHENQWRGATFPQAVGTRKDDIRRLYESPDWTTAAEIINRYGIDYVVYGQTERGEYPVVGEQKFIDHLVPICQFGDSVVYRVTPPALWTR
jgi:YYY domain-containing protein